jgi:hypothetical protein
MTVAIVDYGSGNLRSAAKAIERAAREAGADDRVLVTSNPREVADADRVVLPGVGAFADWRADRKHRALRPVGQYRQRLPCMESNCRFVYPERGALYMGKSGRQYGDRSYCELHGH